ncbi:MAG: LLM class flavin-dependent oxidoreductase [Alphaproteobacteria bacterium]
MRVYHFSENPYPKAWNADKKSLRITLPNRHFDPKDGAVLINRYIDEWAMCDELGLDIWVNEHHSTATCLSASTMLPMAILARETKKARLLTLGVPIAMRADPVLAAEELAYIDVISYGRLEMGLVKGYSTEVAPANANPATLSERYWEAHDLIIKAMTTHDGPFNWEGEHFQFRQVNIWPRPYQEPHPPVWVTGFTPSSAPAIADRGHIVAFGINARLGRDIVSTYRSHVAKLGRPAPGADRFGYMVLIGCGETEAEGHRFASQIKGYLETTGIVPPHFSAPPGYFPVQAKVAEIRRGQQGIAGSIFQTDREGNPIRHATAPIADLIRAGAVIAGNPDQVFEQIRELNEYMGGIGHLLAMMHGGVLSHEDTAKNLTLFSREVLPRLKDLDVPQTREIDQYERIRERAVG